MIEKVKFGVYLSTELLDKWRRFIADQYPEMPHGIISFETGQALQSWMSTHKDTQSCLSKRGANPIPNVFIVKEQVKHYLKAQFGYDQIYKIPKKHLEIAIGALRGTDPRTVKKWFKLFEKYGVIKWFTPGMLEFI